MKKYFAKILTPLVCFLVIIFLFPLQASAHCDTLDGPVISAARKALDTGNPNYILIWVKPESEEAIRKALKRARDKKRLAKTKKELESAEMELFETLVKIHREGEGAQYEGIKPAGSVEPEIALADQAVTQNNLTSVLSHISSPANQKIIQHLFRAVQAKSHYDLDNVPLGREFIEAYVVFIHAVEKAIHGVTLNEHHLHEH